MERAQHLPYLLRIKNIHGLQALYSYMKEKTGATRNFVPRS